MPISMISTNQDRCYEEREGVNYTMYVRTQVYVQFAHFYSQTTSLKNGGHLTGGLLARGGNWPGGWCPGGLCPRGQLSGGRLSREQLAGYPFLDLNRRRACLRVLTSWRSLFFVSIKAISISDIKARFSLLSVSKECSFKSEIYTTVFQIAYLSQIATWSPPKDVAFVKNTYTQ